MRRVRVTMKCYLPPAHNMCGGGRFDPSLLLDPTKDWRAYDEAARGDLSLARGKRGSFTRAFDQIRYRLTLASRLFAVATKLVIAKPNETPRHAERRKRGSQVVALLASSLTMVTSEPLFIPLLKDGLKRAGFQQTRGTNGKTLSQDTIASETGPGASNNVADGRKLKSSEATSTHNASATELGRHWGRKVPTGKPAKLDQPLSE